MFIYLFIYDCKFFIIHVKFVPNGGLANNWLNIVCTMCMCKIGVMGSLMAVLFVSVSTRSIMLIMTCTTTFGLSFYV